LNGVSVSFNGVPAPLFYTSPLQLNAQVPYSVVTGTGQMNVTRGAYTLGTTVHVASVSPGLFTVSQNGSGQGIALHSNGSLVSSTNPAFPGESLMVFGNGFGPLVSPVPAGTLSPGTPVATVNTPLADIGGVPAQVSFSGLAPGFIGVNQFNVEVPVGLPTSSGTQLQAILNGIASNTVTLSVLASGGTISISSLSGLPGTTVSVPVTLTLGSGVAADSVAFTFVVSPGPGAAALNGPLSFQQSAGMPAPSSTNASLTNTISVGWSGLSPARAGTILLGNVLVPLVANDVGQSYTLQISSSSGSLGATALNILPGGSAVLQVPAGLVALGNTTASPGRTTRIPVTLALSSGISLDSIAFGIRLDPNIGAPSIAGPLTFQPDAAQPGPSQIDNGAGPNLISISYLGLGTALTGTLHLGDIVTALPGTVLSGQSYTASFTGVSASLTTVPVALGLGPAALVSVNATYLVSDVFPATSDYAGNFGDGTINTLDLINTLRAVTNIPGFKPAACSDRFDAMDSYPVDVGNQRGGDGLLNTLDLIETLKRVAGTDASRPTRVARGLSCPTAMPASAEALRRAPVTENLWFGAAEQMGDGVVRVPVYMRASRTQALSFSVGISGQGGSLRFVPGEVAAPALQDNGVEGTLAVAWLEEISATTGGNMLLGYVQVSGTDPSAPFTLDFFGVDQIAK
jgi:uncharacterized protein (TIGR03437 family)